MRVPTGFSQVVFKALAEIEPSEEKRRALLARITAAQPSNKSIDITEAKNLVDTLDKLIPKLNQHEGVREYCLFILSGSCRARVILPESYTVSPVVRAREPWKHGRLADIWGGNLEPSGNVCIKAFRQHRAEKQEQIKGEFYYHIVKHQWRRVVHVNVHPFLGVTGDIPPFGLVSPQMLNGNVLEYIGRNPNANRLSMSADAACGIMYLHSQGIVHGGINPRNILIAEDGSARIADFQISAIITDPAVTGLCGTTTCRLGVVRYMAPEQVNPRGFGMANGNAVKPSDVHSLSMTTYEVLTGIEPYPGITGEGPLATFIAGGTRPSRPSSDASTRWPPNAVWNMLESCWIPNPLSRLRIEEVHRILERSAGSQNRTGGPQGPREVSVSPGSDASSDPPVRNARQSFTRTLLRKIRGLASF